MDVIHTQAKDITAQGRKWQMTGRESKLNTDHKRQAAARKDFIEEVG